MRDSFSVGPDDLRTLALIQPGKPGFYQNGSREGSSDELQAQKSRSGGPPLMNRSAWLS